MCSDVEVSLVVSSEFCAVEDFLEENTCIEEEVIIEDETALV